MATKTETMPQELSRAVEVTCYVCAAIAALGVVLAVISCVEGVSGGMRGGLFDVRFGVLLQGSAAWMLFTLPGQVRQRRAELLARRAAGEGSVTFVEGKAWPDSVTLSAMFGLLSLVSFTALFAPAATVAGLVAVARGHLAGLIGLVMGGGALALLVLALTSVT